ncbi:hypothetical protein BDW68DRAFT_158060 [Aspergillus falconensis]
MDFAQTPRLTLSLTGWTKLSARVSKWAINAISFTIRRAKDGYDGPCVFQWSP